jgi:hypothetical protein
MPTRLLLGQTIFYDDRLGWVQKGVCDTTEKGKIGVMAFIIISYMRHKELYRFCYMRTTGRWMQIFV